MASQFEIIIFCEFHSVKEVAGQKKVHSWGLVGKYGSSLLVSSSSSLECLECSLLPFLSLQLLPSSSPAGLLQAKRLQNLTGLNARKVLCWWGTVAGQMSRFGCSCSSSRLEGRQQLVSQLVQLSPSCSFGWLQLLQLICSQFHCP